MTVLTNLLKGAIWLTPAVVLGVMPVAAQDKLLMFPAEQFGRAYLVMPQSTVNLENVLGRNANFERLINYSKSDHLRKLGEPVGRLDLLIERSGQMGVTTCTASIISEKYILTNNHCAPRANSPHKFKKAALLMNFLGEDKEDQTKTFKVTLKPVEQDADLDYAIFQVDGNPSAEFGKITIKPRDPTPGESLLIIHHPAGLPKHATRGGCRASTPRSVRGSDILHRCDTLPGSSGSPIFASDSGEVIGIHYAGASFSAPGSYNYGKRLRRIAGKSRIIAAVLRADEKRAIQQAGRAEADRIRRRQEFERKLRAELEKKFGRQVSANEKETRARYEAELRAKLEKELREKLERERRAGAKSASLPPAARPSARAVRRKLVDPARLAGGPHVGEYKIRGIRVPLPAGDWYRIFDMKSKAPGRNHKRQSDGLAKIDRGKIAAISLVSTNLKNTDTFFHGKKAGPCRVSDGKFFFADKAVKESGLTVCWKFRRFKWKKYEGAMGAGKMNKLRRPPARFSYFLTEHGIEDKFYGFDFFVGTKGRYIRAFHLFNSSHGNFDEKLRRGRNAEVKKIIFGLAARIGEALVSGLSGGNDHFADARDALNKISVPRP